MMMKSSSFRRQQKHRNSAGASASTIRVVAPATLDEDYTFDVTLGDDNDDNDNSSRRCYTVTVPKGGVQKGQVFEIPYPGSDDDDDDEENHRGDDNYNGGEDGQTVPCRSNSNDNNDYYEDETLAATTAIGRMKHRGSGDDEDDEEYDDEAPREKWRHALCACCDVLTQATFWTALLLPPVLIAQLATRLGLSYHGRPLPISNKQQRSSSHTVFADATEEANLSYNKIVLSFVTVLCLGNVLPGVGWVVIGIYVLLLMVYVGSNIRYTMRQRYRIPTQLPIIGGGGSGSSGCCTGGGPSNCCSRARGRPPKGTSTKTTTKQTTQNNNNNKVVDGGRCEDCLCMTLCGCCALIQMARHTHNDKDYPGFCCTTTGLELAAPKIV